MAVFISKDKTELLVTCNCGCEDSFHMRLYEEDKDYDIYGYMSFMKGNFYTDSNLSFWRVLCIKAKRIWRIIRNKDYCYSDTILSKSDIEEIKKYFNENNFG